MTKKTQEDPLPKRDKKKAGFTAKQANPNNHTSSKRPDGKPHEVHSPTGSIGGREKRKKGEKIAPRQRK